MKIALVMVTFNRCAVLARSLRAIDAQTRPPDSILVVDNGSRDDTLEMLAREYPAVRAIACGDNGGYYGGLARGMREAFDQGYEALWLMDDDSVAPPEALAMLEQGLRDAPEAVALGFLGARLHFGRIRHLKTPEALQRQPRLAPHIHQVDVFEVDGALVRREAVAAIGLPHADYFMMIGALEYSYRMTRAGLRVAVFDRDRMRRGRLGGSTKLPWRAYYKARNQTRMAVQHRSAVLLAGALVRHAGLALSYLRSGQPGRARATARGVWHGLRGRMGRTVEPEM